MRRCCSGVISALVHRWRRQDVWHSIRQVKVAAEVLNCLVSSEHRCCRRREAFDLFDTDGSGTIDAKELKVAMR